MKIKNVSAFAKSQGISRQLMEYRVKAGWQFGKLDGVTVMYNPTQVKPVIGASSESFLEAQDDD